ncbi:unnamed protein product [Effrenium voratum]|uniref:Uncharacterized protein n=1 Tax=Effrenium voratum TaxID=2562239 RepID=A0AA36IUM6_9DINO|nr:unnamed protein product [Effrenium voratum]
MGIGRSDAVRPANEWTEPPPELALEGGHDLFEQLNRTQLENIFGMMEQRDVKLRSNLKLMLQDMKRNNKGMCPTEGKWADLKWKKLGCAPFDEDLRDLHCTCPPVMGLRILPRQCADKTADFAGIFEGDPTVATAKSIFAGECKLAPMVHYAGASFTISLVAILAVWCVASGRFHKETEIEEEEVSEPTATGEDQVIAQNAERRRMEIFEEFLNNSKTVNELAKKVSALPPPPGSRAIDPVKGNIYRFWALGGRKKTWLHWLGLRVIFLIQLVAPLAILRWAVYTYEWEKTEVRFVKYEFGDYAYGGSHVFARVLQVLFTYSIVLHCLSIVKKAAKENALLYTLFENLQKMKDTEKGEPLKLEVSRWAQSCLVLDCGMLCYLTTVGLVDMVLIFTMAGSPKDICFDALGLLFIFHLHEVDGGLSFVSVQDFHADRVGELCLRIAQEEDFEEEQPEATDADEAEAEGAEKKPEEKRPSAEEPGLARQTSGSKSPRTPSKRLSLNGKRPSMTLTSKRRLRTSIIWKMTELVIYIILLFVPVFQLFIVDGLQPRAEGVDAGILGAHLVDDEATMADLVVRQRR